MKELIEQITVLGAAPDGPSTLTVPNDVTVAGGEPPAGLVDTLVRDALRRSTRRNAGRLR